MSDHMNAKAKERHFAKPRQFDPVQMEWITKFQELARRLPHDRLIFQACRDVLLTAKAPVDILSPWGREMMEAAPIAAERPEIVERFQWLMREQPARFRGEDVLKRKIRELAQGQGITTQEIQQAFSRIV